MGHNLKNKSVLTTDANFYPLHDILTSVQTIFGHTPG